MLGFNKFGMPHVAMLMDPETEAMRPVFEKKAHPLLKILIEYIAKNSQTLADLEMTPKAQDDQQALRGYLEQRGETRQAALEHSAKQTRLLENLSHLIARSQGQLARDPILAEYREVEGDG